MEINDYGADFLTPEELFENIYTNKIKNFKNLMRFFTGIIRKIKTHIMKIKTQFN